MGFVVKINVKRDELIINESKCTYDLKDLNDFLDENIGGFAFNGDNINGLNLFSGTNFDKLDFYNYLYGSIKNSVKNLAILGGVRLGEDYFRYSNIISDRYSWDENFDANAYEYSDYIEEYGSIEDGKYDLDFSLPNVKNIILIDTQICRLCIKRCPSLESIFVANCPLDELDFRWQNKLKEIQLFAPVKKILLPTMNELEVFKLGEAWDCDFFVFDSDKYWAEKDFVNFENTPFLRDLMLPTCVNVDYSLLPRLECLELVGSNIVDHYDFTYNKKLKYLKIQPGINHAWDNRIVKIVLPKNSKVKLDDFISSSRGFEVVEY